MSYCSANRRWHIWDKGICINCKLPQCSNINPIKQRRCNNPILGDHKQELCNTHRVRRDAAQQKGTDMAKVITGFRPHYHVGYKLNFPNQTECFITLAVHTATTEKEANDLAEHCLTMMVHGHFVWSHLQTERRD